MTKTTTVTINCDVCGGEMWKSVNASNPPDQEPYRFFDVSYACSRECAAEVSARMVADVFGGPVATEVKSMIAAITPRNRKRKPKKDPCFLTRGHTGEHQGHLEAPGSSPTPWCGVDLMAAELAHA